MDTFPWQSLVPVIGGTLALTAFFLPVADVLRHRRSHVLRRWVVPVGGDTLPTEVVARLEPGQEGDWGWIREDGDDLVAFFDTMDDTAGHFRLSSPVPYRARVSRTDGTVRFEAPVLPFVVAVLALFPLSLLALTLHHKLVSRWAMEGLHRLAA